MKGPLSLVLIVLLVGSVLLSGESTLISMEQAQQNALKAVGGGKVTLAVKAKELGKIVWSVNVAGATQEFEVWVDAHNGDIDQIVTQPLAQEFGYIAKRQAEQAALKAVGGGTVIQTQRDQWKGYHAWDVTITQAQSEYDVYVNAHSAVVLTVVKQNNSAQANQKIIAKAEAIRRALQAVGGGRLLLIGLETNENSRDWSVDVKAPNGLEYEAKVNAYTGGVIATKVGG